MAEPSRRAGRLTIAGAMLAVIGIGAAGFVLGRSTVEPTRTPPAATEPPPSPTPMPSAALPAPQSPLGRAELIAAASRAADALAVGLALPESVTGLAGREFQLRLPFGCPGAPQPDARALSAQYDQKAEVLRVRAEPAEWAPEAWLPKRENVPSEPPAVESVEGFWISRPWTSSEACPASTGTNVPSAEAERTLGIAQLYTPDNSRVGRRDGKAYEAVEPVAPEALNLSQGLRLRLRGKLARAPGAGPILCRMAGDTRPTCLISVIFEEVAIENAATGATLATWDVSSQTGATVDR